MIVPAASYRTEAGTEVKTATGGDAGHRPRAVVRSSLSLNGSGRGGKTRLTEPHFRFGSDSHQGTGALFPPTCAFLGPRPRQGGTLKYIRGLKPLLPTR